MCKASCLSAADLECLAASVLALHAWFQAYSWDCTWASALVGPVFYPPLSESCFVLVGP